jgi:hypothetical protein
MLLSLNWGFSLLGFKNGLATPVEQQLAIPCGFGDMGCRRNNRDVSAEQN